MGLQFLVGDGKRSVAVSNSVLRFTTEKVSSVYSACVLCLLLPLLPWLLLTSALLLPTLAVACVTSLVASYLMTVLQSYAQHTLMLFDTQLTLETGSLPLKLTIGSTPAPNCKPVQAGNQDDNTSGHEVLSFQAQENVDAAVAGDQISTAVADFEDFEDKVDSGRDTKDQLVRAAETCSPSSSGVTTLLPAADSKLPADDIVDAKDQSETCSPASSSTEPPPSPLAAIKLWLELKGKHSDLVRLDAKWQELEEKHHYMQMELDLERIAQQEILRDLRQEALRHAVVMSPYRVQLSPLVKTVLQQHKLQGQGSQDTGMSSLDRNVCISNSIGRSDTVSSLGNNSSPTMSIGQRTVDYVSGSCKASLTQQLQATQEHLASLKPCASTLAAIREAIRDAEGHKKRLQLAIEELKNKCRALNVPLKQFDADGYPSERMWKQLQEAHLMHGQMERDVATEMLRLQTRTRTFVKQAKPRVEQDGNIIDMSRSSQDTSRRWDTSRRDVSMSLVGMCSESAAAKAVRNGRAFRGIPWPSASSKDHSKASATSRALNTCPAPVRPTKRVGAVVCVQSCTSSADCAGQQLLGRHRRMGESALVGDSLVQQVAAGWMG